MISNFSSAASLHGLLGGLLIGLAASLLWVLNGRVAGVSGITAGVWAASREEASWRVAFVAGLVLAGVAGASAQPSVFGDPLTLPLPQMASAGALVGVGTALGSGCTSGHGVCGLARFSARSLAATIVFILVGMLTVALMRAVVGGVS